MDFEHIEKLIRIFEASGLGELEIEENGRRMRLQKSIPAPPAPQALPAPVTPILGAAVPQQIAAPTEEAASAESIEEGYETIESPMVGTFYTSPAPGEPAFVAVGDAIEENQTVCIVEAMKLMNEVVAKFAGKIEKVLVEDGQPVEFGQPLFRIRAVDQA